MLASLLAALAPAATDAGALHAQAGGTATAEVFRRFADRVVKIQVVESGSSAKATIGSGFFVSGEGHIVSNYHVVSELIHAPERYRAEMVDVAGTTAPVTVEGVDVVHDLAVLRTTRAPAAHFRLDAGTRAQGERLYALGHPKDLGLSIVEGTYNGLLQHTLYPRLHFTGSLNSGMSGGPTIDADGHAVGVNVSTAGNQMSFLVPVAHAAELLNRVRAGGGIAARTLPQVGRQLRDYQDLYLKNMFAGRTKMIDLGPFRVVTEPAPFFRCWADAERKPGMTYQQVSHRCSTDDYVFIAGDQSSGVVSLRHELISTRRLNPSRFFALYESVFSRDDTPSGEEEHVTSWRCATRNVRHDRTKMRAVLCLRRYVKLGELYDGVLKVAVLGRNDTGLVSTLTMTGVTFENVDRVSRRYLERISWR